MWRYNEQIIQAVPDLFFHTRGTHELELFDEKAPVLDVRDDGGKL